MLEFDCQVCYHSINVAFEYIGELVECPHCSSSQIVPDISYTSNMKIADYVIKNQFAKDYLWTSYVVNKDSGDKTDFLLKIPSQFFLKHTSDFNAFLSTVIRNASINNFAFPRLLNKNITGDNIYFVYDYIRETHGIAYFAKIDFNDLLQIIRRIAIVLKNAWEEDRLLHRNLIPDNIQITNEKQVRIYNMGISDILLRDNNLLEWNFDIWDKRYTCPEFITEGLSESPLSDIYSLGGLLFLMVTGHHPYEQVNPKDIYKVPLRDPLQYNHSTPKEIVDLYYGMMNKDPKARIQTWDEVIECINAIIGLEGLVANQTQFVDRYLNNDKNVPIVYTEMQQRDVQSKKVFHLNKKKKEKEKMPHKHLIFKKK